MFPITSHDTDNSEHGLTGTRPGRPDFGSKPAKTRGSFGDMTWFPPEIPASAGAMLFDEAGNLTSPEIRTQLQAFLAGFVADIAG